MTGWSKQEYFDAGVTAGASAVMLAATGTYAVTPYLGLPPVYTPAAAFVSCLIMFAFGWA